MNDIIITSPTSENFYFGKTISVSFKLENIDKYFHKIKIYLNDILVYENNKFLDTFIVQPIPGLNHLKAYCVNSENKFLLNTDVEIYFNNITDTIEKEKQISKFIKHQLPEFIQAEYPKFIDFIQGYYEFLEKTNNHLYVPYNLENYKDPDITSKWIFEKLKAQYMPEFDVKLSIDRESGLNINESNVLKNIKQFYDSKGTEDSIKFLFKILYDTDAKIKYPREHVLRPSAGSFITKDIIKCYLKNFSYVKLLKSAKLYQYDENNVIVATCYVTNITVIKQNGIYVATLDVKNIVGTFNINKNTYLRNVIDGTEVRDFLITIVPQTNYIINFSIYDVDGSGEIDMGDVGQILTMTGPVFPATILYDFDGDGEITISEINVVFSYCGTPAGQIDTPVPNQVIKRTRYQIPFGRRTHGYWAKKNSILSIGNVLPDNIYYHDYSYEVNSKVSDKKYLEVVKKLGHPSGFKIFGSYDSTTNLKINSTTQNEYSQLGAQLLLGNYAAYTFETKQDLNYVKVYNNDVPQRAYPSGFKIGFNGDSINSYSEEYVATIKELSNIGYNELPSPPLEEEDLSSVPDIPLNMPVGPDPTYANGAPTTKKKYFVDQFYPTDLVPSTTGASAGLRPIDKYWVVGIHPNQLINNINSNASFGQLKLEDVIKIGTHVGNTDNG